MVLRLFQIAAKDVSVRACLAAREMQINRTLRLLIVVAILLAAAIGVTGQGSVPPPPAAEYSQSAWKTFVSSEGGFQISFPGSPAIKSSSVQTDVGQITYHLAGVTSSGNEYAVSYADFPFKTEDPAMVKKILDSAVAQVVSSGGTKLTEGDVALGSEVGRDFMLQRGEWVGRHWVFFVDGRLYAVILAVHPEGAFKDGKASPDIAARTHLYADICGQFFSSFKFVARKAASAEPRADDSNGGLLDSVTAKDSIYRADANAKAEIGEAIKRAAAEHRRVLLVFGANWCYDCHVLDRALHEGEAGKLVAEKYLLVHVDIGEGEKNPELVKEYKIPLNKGVPAVAVLDKDGKLLYSSGQGEFEAARRMLKKDLVKFLTRWKPL